MSGARLLRLARPVHRQLSTLHTSRLRCQQVPPSSLLRVRTLSYSSIPRFVARTLSTPTVVIAIGAVGIIYYVNYKLKQLWKGVTDWSSSIFRTAADPIKSVSDHVSRVVSDESTRREIEKLGKNSLSTVQGAATGVVNSASNGIKSVSDYVSTVKLPKVDTPQVLKDLVSGKSRSGK